MLRSRAVGTRDPATKKRLFTELVDLNVSRGDDATAAGDSAGALSAYRLAFDAAKFIQDARADGLKSKIESLDTKKPQPPAPKRDGPIHSALLDRPMEIVHTRGNEGIQKQVAVNRIKLANSFLARPSADMPSRVSFQLDGTFRLLQGGVAISDASADTPSPLAFKVFVDGKQVWTSFPTRRKGTVQAFHLFILNAKKVELVAESQLRDAAPADAVWVEPLLYTDVIKAPKKPMQDYAGIPLDDRSGAAR